MNTKVLDIKKSITSWDEGIATGDGKLGSILYGDGPIKISVDRIDLWDNRPNEQTFESGFNYKNLIKLAKSGKAGNDADWSEHKRLFDMLSHITPYPSKITAGRIELDFGVSRDDIHSHLDMTDAIADISIPGVAKIRQFNSAIRHVGIMRVEGEYKIDIHIPDYISGDEFGRCALNTGLDEEAENWCMQYPRSKVERDGDFIYYVQKTHTDYTYTLVAMEKKYSDFSEIYYTVATTDDAKDVLDFAKGELVSVAALGYDTLIKEHIKWWHDYNAKSSVVIPDKSMEFVYNASNYYFASCSRKGFYPMALQGVWTADNDSLPPWKGDYHFDTNVQLSYQSYLKANRMSEGEVIVDYLWNMRDTYKKYAKEFFGVDGYLLPSCSTIDGQPIGGWAMYSFAPISTVWMIQSLDEYYLYTGDEKFLRTRLYPIFRDTGKAMLALMEERDGKLYLPLSASPEIFHNEKEAYLEPNSNYDLALLTYLYTKLRDYAKKLGKGKEAEKYEKVLSKLDPIITDPSGIIMLDKTQLLPESHRHFSHVMSIYPLHLINYDTAEHKRIIDATIGHLEILGAGWWCGFSYAMMAQVYAMAGRGNAAYMRLWEFVKFFTGENGFHYNGDYKRYGISGFVTKPFTLEANYGYCDALQEMLLQEHEGFVNLLPAIPDEWDSLEFKKLRSYGGLLVSLKYNKGKIVKVEFVTKRATDIKLKDNYGLADLLGVKAEGGFISLSLKRGKTAFKK